MKNLLAVLVLMLSFFTANAEHNGESHGLGIGGSVFETWGLSYRHYFPGDLGIASNFGGWWGENRTGHLGVAAGLSYTFGHHYFPNSGLPSSSIRIFGIAYLAGVYAREWHYLREETPTKDEKIDIFNLGVGIGPGAEFFFSKNFAIHLEMPWMTFFTLTAFKRGLANSRPNIGGGISYYF